MKKVIILGAGSTAEKFVVKHYSDIEMVKVWDNYKRGSFFGKRIEKPTNKRGNQELIVVCVVSYKYVEVKGNLEELGYEEFADFIFADFWEKGLAICYGNCHANYVKQCLQSSKEFSDKYTFYPLPPIQNIDTKLLNKKIFSHVTLLIGQDIRKNNKYGYNYSLDYVLSIVEDNTEVIIIPNLFGLPDFLFPQLISYDGKSSLINEDIFYYEDTNIVKWSLEKKTVQEMKELICEGGVYDKISIQNKYKEFCLKVKKREEYWDIKILDYIVGNLKYKKLFYEPWHPTEILLEEIAKRLLRYLGFSDYFTYVGTMDNLEVFVYRDVKDALELEYDEKCIRMRNGKECDINMLTIEEYINYRINVLQINELEIKNTVY